MTSTAQEFIVRSDCLHELAGACQRFAGDVLLVERGAFVSAVRRLTDQMPAAESPAESVLMWDWLSGAAMRGAVAHHRWFHRCFGGEDCRVESRPMDSPDGFSADRLRRALIEWAEAYAADFDKDHCWPPAVKAAALLQARTEKEWYLRELAKAVGASSATLERSFNRIYGTTPQRYHSLLRLRKTAVAIRAGDACLEGVALETGYPTVNESYRSFRSETGLTLSAVRHLTDDEFGSLMDGALRLPTPLEPRKELRRRAGRPRSQEPVPASSVHLPCNLQAPAPTVRRAPVAAVAADRPRRR